VLFVEMDLFVWLISVECKVESDKLKV